MKKMIVGAVVGLAGAAGIAAAEFKNGTSFSLGNVPKELVVERRARGRRTRRCPSAYR